MKKKKPNILVEIAKLLACFVAVAVAVQLLTHFVISKDVVSGISMQPTLEDGDRLLSLRQKSIQRGDIVVIDAPDKKGVLYIKRVIGMPGDTVRVSDNKLYVNGRQQKQPYLKANFEKNELQALVSEGKVSPTDKFTYDFSLGTLSSTRRPSVPKNSYFVMGDNRIVSHDGRDFGFIKRNSIQSVVVWRYFPINKMHTY